MEKVRSLKGANGLNAATGEYEDLVKAGVIDAAKVTRSALQNAASIAALFLTTEAVVADKPEPGGAPVGCPVACPTWVAWATSRTRSRGAGTLRPKWWGALRGAPLASGPRPGARRSGGSIPAAGLPITEGRLRGGATDAYLRGGGRGSGGQMKRRGALGAVVLAFGLVLAACGGGGGGDATVSIKTLQAAVANTQAVESSRFSMDMAVDADGHRVTIHGEGVTAGDGKTGQITMTVPSVGVIDERIVDGTIYMNFGDLPIASGLDGKHWVSISLDELRQQTGTDLGGLADQAGGSGSQQGLEYLQGLSGDVTEVGTDTVAGAPATHYQRVDRLRQGRGQAPRLVGRRPSEAREARASCPPTCGSTARTAS